MKLNILCIGDVVGRPGRRIIADKLRFVVKEHGVDCVIVNAENAAGGRCTAEPGVYRQQSAGTLV